MDQLGLGAAKAIQSELVIRDLTPLDWLLRRSEIPTPRFLHRASPRARHTRVHSLQVDPCRGSDGWLGKELRLYAGMPVHYLEIEGGDHGLNQEHEHSVAAIVSWLQSLAFLAPA